MLPPIHQRKAKRMKALFHQMAIGRSGSNVGAEGGGGVGTRTESSDG